MYSRTKLGIVALVGLFFLIIASKFIQATFGDFNFSQTYKFDFAKTFSFEFESSPLQDLVKKSLDDKQGSFAVYIESLSGEEKYGFNEVESFPAASLYKLVLMAAILKEVEEGNLKLDTVITGDKAQLTAVLGSVDFGYEDRESRISYTVEQALTRVGEISDNFAAIMLTNKLSTIKVGIKDEGLLIKMAKELGMNNTNFMPGDDELITTTALDMGAFFRRLYNGQVVSKEASEKIIGYLDGSKINNRIPAGVPEGIKVVHKTGELSRIRNDAGIVYCCKQVTVPTGTEAPLGDNPYLIVMLSKELKFEDEGIEAMANLSRDIYNYFEGKRVVEKSAQ